MLDSLKTLLRSRQLSRYVSGLRNRFHVSSVDPHRLTTPVSSAGFQHLRKYQYHLKSNASWPGSSDSKDCDERNFLIRLKGSTRGRATLIDENCKRLKTGQISMSGFCGRQNHSTISWPKRSAACRNAGTRA